MAGFDPTLEVEPDKTSQKHNFVRYNYQAEQANCPFRNIRELGRLLTGNYRLCKSEGRQNSLPIVSRREPDTNLGLILGNGCLPLLSSVRGCIGSMRSNIHKLFGSPPCGRTVSESEMMASMRVKA